jgi:hypothetical protein
MFLTRKFSKAILRTATYRSREEKVLLVLMLLLHLWIPEPQMIEDPAPGTPTVTTIDLETGERHDWVPM